MAVRLTRREFLRLSQLGATLTALSACDPLGTTARALGNWKPESLRPDQAFTLHLLRRATFGPTSSELGHAQDLGPLTWLEHQLAAADSNPVEVRSRLAGLQTLELSPAELFEMDDVGRAARELIAATLVRQVFSPNQLYEVMVDFWTNHFNIYLRAGQVALLKGKDDREVVRPHALGRFPDLLRASAHSPAMLVYLDNARSRTPSPNENYARELMELHSLGVESGYSHHDVEEVARALTGWTVSGRRGGSAIGDFIFRPEWHDPGAKHILGVHFPGGGKEEGDSLLTLLAEHPSTARHVSAKLCRRFVADDPPSGLVERIAQTYLTTDGDIPSLLRAIFGSAEFEITAGAKLKRPLDFFVSALRVLGADGEFRRDHLQFLTLLGQVPFTWPSPDGFPEEASVWVNTNQSLYRWNMALTLAAGELHGLEIHLPDLSAASFLEEAVDTLARALLGMVLPREARQILIETAHSADLHENGPSWAGLILASPFFQIR